MSSEDNKGMLKDINSNICVAIHQIINFISINMYVLLTSM